MKTRPSLALPALLFFLASCVFIAGCSTPDRRIDQNLELFNTLTAEQQELIKQGRVALGFTPDMVYLAVGEPDRKWTRTDQAGSSEIWSYTTYEGTDGMLLYRGWYHSRYRAYYPYYTAYSARIEREYFRITFQDGKVTAIQQDVR